MMEKPNLLKKYIYQQGTLRYTLGGICFLFGAMLSGSMCFYLIQQLTIRVLPISLKDIGLNDSFIGILCVSVPGILNAIVTPIISYMSDRTRTRWGRRIPYMLVGVPPTTFFLLLIGWGPAIVSYLFPDSSINSVYWGKVAILIFAIIGFNFFNLFSASVMYYIFADVVPDVLMGRFMALFGIVSTGAGFVFTRFCFGYIEGYSQWLYTGFALLYFLGYGAMCLLIKEGSYPPPDAGEEHKSILGTIKIYFKECFTLSFYRLFFFATSLNAISILCRGMFYVFFAQINLGLSIAEYGIILSYMMLLQMVIKIPLGYLTDKFHPIRLYCLGMLLVAVANLIGFFILLSPDMSCEITGKILGNSLTIKLFSYWAFIGIESLMAITYGIQYVAEIPLFAAILPRDRYGQFCSAQALLRSILVIGSGYLAGAFMEITGNYVYIFVWDAIVTIVALGLMWKVYVIWKKLGGDKNYVAP